MQDRKIDGGSELEFVLVIYKKIVTVNKILGVGNLISIEWWKRESLLYMIGRRGTIHRTTGTAALIHQGKVKINITKNSI